MKLLIIILLLLTGCAGFGRDDDGAAGRNASLQFEVSMERLRGEYGIARGVCDAK